MIGAHRQASWTGRTDCHRWQAKEYMGDGKREEFGRVRESNRLHSIKVGYGLNKFKNIRAKINMVDVT